MKRALVTGANRGIGFAIAKGLADRGHDVLLGSRNPAAGKDAAHRIGATALDLDVADPASIARAVEVAGEVDILVNNAGILGSGSVLQDKQDFSDSMAVMVHGPYLLMHHLTPHMVAQGFGRIVNVSSGWGAFSEGVGGPGAYGVAKAALNALTVSAARSLPSSVKVNAMCPGWVRTAMGGAGATRSPEQGADTALWLATLPDDGPTGGFFRDREPIDW
ncbi:SDR family NAD(P)-dependent oxidoreductase [Tropicimonas marinistellae]|uniref:SDR family NAD(P)-dependent oxidoreductase n=1 Tax=Tropicimonas marinistellae TaxID=1739787 RepID=UPI000835D324|nr:SDR family NAD(P)-dependent oxidoreductase [Tropicimonas marinistellae]